MLDFGCGTGAFCTKLDQMGYEVTGIDPSKEMNTKGGWHDAGAYNKFVPTTAVSAAFLLYAYEDFPDFFYDGQLNIPESHNSIPDVLDRASDFATRSRRTNFVTLPAVADPQSQKVQRNGQPRLVSQSPIQLSVVFASMISSKVPSRKGDGISSRSRTRSKFGLRTNVPSASPMLTPGIPRHACRSGKASRIFRNVRSPSLCTARSICGLARRNTSGWSGT